MIEYGYKNRFVWKPSTTQGMGRVEAEIELINDQDLIDVRKNVKCEEEIRRMRITALVDSGAQYLCINENIQEVLQLPVRSRKRIELADGSIVHCDIVGPVELRFANRDTLCKALVLPGNAEPLLGLLP